jgi:3-oxoacyl-[acyl-carrier protein] reductase
VQIIVNNAGIHDDAAFPGMRAVQCHCVIGVLLNGFFRVTQPLILPMIVTRLGRVINIFLMATLSGNRRQLNCAAAKGALNSATKALCLEVASRGAKVDTIASVIIASPMADGSFAMDMIER